MSRDMGQGGDGYIRYRDGEGIGVHVVGGEGDMNRYMGRAEWWRGDNGA